MAKSSKAAIDLPAQGCHMHLAGGRIQRPGDPASPMYRGVLDSSAGPLALEILAEPGGLYDPRGLVDLDHLKVFGHGHHAAMEVDAPEVEEMHGWPVEVVIVVNEQSVNLTPLPPEAARNYRVKVMTGVMDTSIGQWDASLVGREVILRIGWGSYVRT